MPRPGPRPYECVKRAWHSDRHKPIRGSLIQEIFRLANDMHSAATRKNKEWQEKLPIVVLKVEEIMYSKANSEAEYGDLKTLVDRVTDAIDTIIRKEDSPEIGDFLQPCIEAALNLGCVPRRVSKSQHRSNPMCYLSPNASDVRPSSLKTSDSNTSSLGHILKGIPDFSNPNNYTSQFPSWNSSMDRIQCPNSKKNEPSAFKGKLPVHVSSFTCPNLAGAYPMYYSDNHPGMAYHQSLQFSEDQMYRMTAATTSGFMSKAETSFEQNLIGSKFVTGTSKGDSTISETRNEGWGLSLRLGLPSSPSKNAKPLD
ncbi:uncharacterized protein LOC122036856 [Zingiber officinale]|uniref:uncharacterized protein LOC122036856 n=1 Tax=Zingiber officinale TaxID=94328 RepID=UPI001C4C8E9E|nr:uncharacterized protein LOC122036856 [Zingiber officinale]XP_042452215.1 uncharacterized protein LOC122036856 [Zingiber officinale]